MNSFETAYQKRNELKLLVKTYLHKGRTGALDFDLVMYLIKHDALDLYSKAFGKYSERHFHFVQAPEAAYDLLDDLNDRLHGDRCFLHCELPTFERCATSQSLFND